VQSIEELVGALYNSISFAVGNEPDLASLRELMHPNGVLVHATAAGVVTMSVDSFIAKYRENIRTQRIPSFHERQVFSRVQRFGAIAHVLSTYEARGSAADADPFARGINSIQLVLDRGRWYVFSIVWDDERSDNPIPPELLPASEM
jgi:hypothetical protein